MIVKVSMRQCLGSLAKRNRTDMPSTQCGFSEAGTEWQAASLRDPELQQRQKKMPPFASLEFTLNTFSSVEFVPNLPNNRKCHLFGTHPVQSSSLLHYALNGEACYSWKVFSDLLSPSHMLAVAFQTVLTICPFGSFLNICMYFLVWSSQ